MRSLLSSPASTRVFRRLCSSPSSTPSSEVSIDRTGLRGVGRVPGDDGNHSAERRSTQPAADPDGNKAALTPLGRSLYKRIAFAGPVTVAAYMSECLTNPRDGYYMKRDVFGEHGDFTTAPEVSQVFGEMLGVWVWDSWQAMGEPERVDLVELGAGRGTLMADVLRTLTRLGDVKWRVRFVEASPFLRDMQKKAVQGFPMQASWHENLAEIDDKTPSIVLAQEFMDAMPVNQFVKINGAWHERFVDIDQDPDSTHHFRYILSPRATPASTLYKEHLNRASGGAATPSPSSSEEEKAHVVEISPAALSLTHQLCARIQQSGRGAALLVDYGHDSVHQASTLRAIYRHRLVTPLAHQGEADLSADVDFGALRRQAAPFESVRAYGPVTQSTLLHALGVSERFRALAANQPPAAVARLAEDYNRLTSREEMGDVYKALALAHGSQRVPAGGFRKPA